MPLRFNIAPTQEIAVIVETDSGRELNQMRWGLIPSWSKDPKSGPPLFNARSETAAEKPTFRSAMRHRRCLIPADGFYEWKKRHAANALHLECFKGHSMTMLDANLQRVIDVWPGLPLRLQEAILALVDAGGTHSEGKPSQNASFPELTDVRRAQNPPTIHDITWRIAQQCRSIVQACLREEEWQDVDRKFCDVIGREIAVWCK